MKKMILMGLCLLPFMSAHATGGFDCVTVDKSIEVFGTTAAAPGNPLISATVLRDGQEIDYSVTQAVGYWNVNGEELKLALADKEYMQIDYELNVQTSIYDDGVLGYGSLKVAGEEYSYDITCQF